jgi:hypothetical protein
MAKDSGAKQMPLSPVYQSLSDRPDAQEKLSWLERLILQQMGNAASGAVRSGIGLVGIPGSIMNLFAGKNEDGSPVFWGAGQGVDWWDEFSKRHGYNPSSAAGVVGQNLPLAGVTGLRPAAAAAVPGALASLITDPGSHEQVTASDFAQLLGGLSPLALNGASWVFQNPNKYKAVANAVRAVPGVDLPVSLKETGTAMSRVLDRLSSLLDFTGAQNRHQSKVQEGVSILSPKVNPEEVADLFRNIADSRRNAWLAATGSKQGLSDVLRQHLGEGEVPIDPISNAVMGLLKENPSAYVQGKLVEGPGGIKLWQHTPADTLASARNLFGDGYTGPQLFAIQKNPMSPITAINTMTAGKLTKLRDAMLPLAKGGNENAHAILEAFDKTVPKEYHDARAAIKAVSDAMERLNVSSSVGKLTPSSSQTDVLNALGEVPPTVLPHFLNGWSFPIADQTAAGVYADSMARALPRVKPEYQDLLKNATLQRMLSGDPQLLSDPSPEKILSVLGPGGNKVLNSWLLGGGKQAEDVSRLIDIFSKSISPKNSSTVFDKMSNSPYWHFAGGFGLPLAIGRAFGPSWGAASSLVGQGLANALISPTVAEGLYKAANIPIQPYAKLSGIGATRVAIDSNTDDVGDAGGAESASKAFLNNNVYAKKEQAHVTQQAQPSWYDIPRLPGESDIAHYLRVQMARRLGVTADERK